MMGHHITLTQSWLNNGTNIFCLVVRIQSAALCVTAAVSTSLSLTYISVFSSTPSTSLLCRCDLTIFPYEGEAQLEELAGVAVRMAWTEAGQKLRGHIGHRGVDVDGGEHPILLTQQAMEHQQGQGWLCRVGIYDDVTESTKVLDREKYGHQRSKM